MWARVAVTVLWGVQSDDKVAGNVVLTAGAQADIVEREARVGELALLEDVDVAAGTARDVAVAASGLAVEGGLRGVGHAEAKQREASHGREAHGGLRADCREEQAGAVRGNEGRRSKECGGQRATLAGASQVCARAEGTMGKEEKPAKTWRTPEFVHARFVWRSLTTS